jgi:hypothetical protein
MNSQFATPCGEFEKPSGFGFLGTAPEIRESFRSCRHRGENLWSSWRATEARVLAHQALKVIAKSETETPNAFAGGNLSDSGVRGLAPRIAESFRNYCHRGKNLERFRSSFLSGNNSADSWDTLWRAYITARRAQDAARVRELQAELRTWHRVHGQPLPQLAGGAGGVTNRGALQHDHERPEGAVHTIDDDTLEDLWRMIWALPLIAEVFGKSGRPRVVFFTPKTGLRMIRRFVRYRERNNAIAIARIGWVGDEVPGYGTGLIIKQMVDTAALLVTRQITLLLLASSKNAGTILLDPSKPLRARFLAALHEAETKLHAQFRTAALHWLEDVGRSLDEAEARA